jgi:hypothetical protein
LPGDIYPAAGTAGAPQKPDVAASGLEFGPRVKTAAKNERKTSEYAKIRLKNSRPSSSDCLLKDVAVHANISLND